MPIPPSSLLPPPAAPSLATAAPSAAPMLAVVPARADTTIEGSERTIGIRPAEKGSRLRTGLGLVIRVGTRKSRRGTSGMGSVEASRVLRAPS